MWEGNGKFLFIVCGVPVSQDEMSPVDDGGDGKTTMGRQLKAPILKIKMRAEVRGKRVRSSRPPWTIRDSVSNTVYTFAFVIQLQF